MTPTLVKYVLRGFWYPLLLILFLFIFLVVVADVVDHLDDFMAYDLPLAFYFKYYLYVLPTVIVFLIPISVLLSALKLFRTMSISNSYIALIMGGIPLHVIVLPLVLSGLCISLGTFYLGNNIAPQTRFKKKVMQKEKFKIHKPILRGISITGPDGLIYYINEYHRSKRIIKDLMITAYSPEGKLQKRIFAGELILLEDHWEGSDIQIQPYGYDGLPLVSEQLKTLKFGKLIEPEEILFSKRDPKYLSAKQLKELSKQVPESKPRIKNSLLLDYHRKFAVAALPLVILCIAVPFGISPVREVSSKSIGTGVVISLLYYILDAIFYQIGKGQILNPWMSAWAANFCFLGLGCFFLKNTPK